MFRTIPAKYDFKGTHWPGEVEQSRGLKFVDPCETAMSDHFSFDTTGAAQPRTAAGRYTIAHINLDRHELKLWRERKQLLARRLTEVEALIADIAPTAALLSLPQGTKLLASLEKTGNYLRSELHSEYGDWL